MNKTSSILALALMSLLVSCKVPESMAWVESTLTGSGTKGFADGTGTTAQFKKPYSVAVNSSGNIYVTDSGNHLIRKITPADRIGDRVVSTLAGSGTEGSGNGTGTAAQFKNPFGVAVDSSGNAFVADQFNHRIRRITPKGVVSIFAGSTEGFADGTGNTAQFNYPTGVAVDSSGNVYVADSGNHLIRKITPAGVVSTLVGTGTEGFADGTGTEAQFKNPSEVAVDSSGNVYVVDADNNRIRKITPADRIEDRVASTLVGSTEGFADGTGTEAQFHFPRGVAVDSRGNVYVADGDNHRIRRITPAGVVSIFAGSTEGFADGIGTEAQFDFPSGVAVDSSGNVYVADSGNHRIRRITPAGVVSTLAGTGTEGFADGAGNTAQFEDPYDLAVDSFGNVYVVDFRNQRIRKITPAGVVSTLAGTGIRGHADGTGTEAQFNGPTGVAVDSSGSIYVADQGNHLIRKITPAEVVSTLAGTGTEGFANGPGTMAQFHYPLGVAVDSSGNVYVADIANHRIRKITPAGVVSTFVGTGSAGHADGTGAEAQFNLPLGVAVDSSGNVYVADAHNHRIRKITPAGVVSTFAGTGTAGSGNGTGTTAQFEDPYDLAVDSFGNIYVGDFSNHRIRKIEYKVPWAATR